MNLVAGTASFESGMNKASQLSRDTGKNIQSSFDSAAKSGKDFSTSTIGSMHEARGGIMLVSEELGGQDSETLAGTNRPDPGEAQPSQPCFLSSVW